MERETHVVKAVGRRYAESEQSGGSGGHPMLSLSRLIRLTDMASEG